MAGEKQVAVVTGATRGLGRSVATWFAQHDFRVVIVGRSTSSQPHRLLPGTLDEVEADLKAQGADVLAIRADLSALEEVRSVVDGTLEWAGRCDALIANASYTSVGSFFDVPASRWSTGYNITVTSTVGLLQGFLGGMLEREHGCVIGVGSRLASYNTAPAPDWKPREAGFGPPLLYGVSKAALERMIVGLHDDYGGHGVSFIDLRAGEITSESWHLMTEQMKMGGREPSLLHSPDEIAAGVGWLVTQTDEDFSGRIVDFPWLQEQGVIPFKVT